MWKHEAMRLPQAQVSRIGNGLHQEVIHTSRDSPGRTGPHLFPFVLFLSRVPYDVFSFTFSSEDL